MLQTHTYRRGFFFSLTTNRDGWKPPRFPPVGAAAGASSPPPPTSAADAALAKLLQLAQRVEASPEAPNSKQLVLDFEALAALHRGNQLDALGVEALAHFALGSLRIRFARVWPLARQLLLELARSP